MEQYTLMYRRVLPKTEAIAYTRRKRPAKQPCFDSEGEPLVRRVFPKTEAIAYTRRKRQAKQPCFVSEGEPQKATDVVLSTDG